MDAQRHDVGIGDGMAGNGPRDWSPPEAADERPEPRWGQRLPAGAPAPQAQWLQPRDDVPFARLNRRRRRRTLAWIWTGTAVLAVLLLVTVAGRAMPFASREWVAGAFPAAAAVVGVPDPASATVDLAHRAFLTAEGRRILYETSPEILGDDVEQACARADHVPGDEIVATGCYAGWLGGGRIFVYRPSDERLLGSMVITAAHELLHAAYDRLAPAEQARVGELVAAETDRLAPDDPTRAQIDWSVGDYEPNRATEQFAYLGSQIMPEGGFAPELEQLYARYFTDRAALVQVHLQSVAVIDDLATQLQDAWNDLAAAEQAVVDARAQLEADRQWHERALPRYNDDVARFNAMDPAVRDRWIETVSTSDGEQWTLPWGESLARRLAELDRVKAELETRGPEIARQEADAAARRTRAEALAADLDNLLDAAYPGRG